MARLKVSRGPAFAIGTSPKRPLFAMPFFVIRGSRVGMDLRIAAVCGGTSFLS